MRTLEQAVPRLVMEENLLGGTPNKQTHTLLADLDYLISIRGMMMTDGLLVITPVLQFSSSTN